MATARHQFPYHSNFVYMISNFTFYCAAEKCQLGWCVNWPKHVSKNNVVCYKFCDPFSISDLELHVKFLNEYSKLLIMVDTFTVLNSLVTPTASNEFEEPSLVKQ